MEILFSTIVNLFIDKVFENLDLKVKSVKFDAKIQLDDASGKDYECNILDKMIII